jgi:hypothetical protein
MRHRAISGESVREAIDHDIDNDNDNDPFWRLTRTPPARRYQANSRSNNLFMWRLDKP